MSKEFYKYLSNKIINYFKAGNLKRGDKFFIEFDGADQVKTFYDVLKDSPIETENFIYKHENGGEFNTYALIFDDIKVIVANSSSVTLDYIVTLRNQVINQTDEWKDTALLIIVDNVIDSIYNGMRSLQREDMPLSILTITKNLKNEINSGNLSKPDKEIINFYLTKKAEDTFDTSLWDYENVLGIINSGKIKQEDLNDLGLFPDSELAELKSPLAIRKRIEDNYEIFEDVTAINQYDDNLIRLKRKFTENVANNLIKDDWKNMEYKKLKNSMNELSNNSNTLNYIENPDKFTEEGLVYWEKPKAQTATGKRKPQIIIFNDPGFENIHMEFEFESTVLKKFLDKKCQGFVKTSGKKLKADLKINSSKTNFFKIKYKHNDSNKLNFEFNIAVVNCKNIFLDSIKTRYEINTSKRRIVVINDESNNKISFGYGDNEEIKSIKDVKEELIISQDDFFTISESSPAWENDSLTINLIYDNIIMPIEIKEDAVKAIPTKSVNIWKWKRENRADFEYNGVKVSQDFSSYYIEDGLKEYLSLEEQIIRNKIFAGEIKYDMSIEKNDLNLSDDLRQAYLEILEFYTQSKNIPSLMYLENKLIELYTNFLEIYNKEIEEIPEDTPLSRNSQKMDLNKIGTFKKGNKILFSSLSPINMAYQLEVNKQCENEEISFNILKRLRSENLVPYIFDKNDDLFKPTLQTDNVEWIVYEKSEDVSVGNTNVFIANIIEEKMNQFISHFSYLFNDESNAPIKINIIRVKQDREVVKGVFNFIYNRLIKGKSIIPVELNIYSEVDKSSFDDLFDCYNSDQLNKFFGIRIKPNLDDLDVIRKAQSNITYYKHDLKDEYDYSHISFYKVGNDTKVANDNMDGIDTGLSLNGLLSDVPSYNNQKEYRNGFGAKNLLNQDDLLVRTTINLNEISENNKNNGENAYSKHKCIVSKPMELKKEETNKLYNKSNWVTFIEPNFGLEYFDKSEDLIIIHYSDQYTSSNKFDIITVTNKHSQYESIIKNFLEDKNIDIAKEDLENVIKMFNCLNGEWLLRVISRFSDYEREKLSIISAVKFGLTLLDHPEIIWIPISLDEILRIAGTVKLPKNEGIFAPSKVKGAHCDDLLFVGIREQDDNINVYYYPVEVKQGINNDTVINKGKEQIENTYQLLKDQTSKTNPESAFENKFYRNFFMQIALSNEIKLSTNHIWDEKQMDRIQDLKPKLLNDDYEISYELEDYIGKGSLMSFKTDCSFLSISDKEDIQVIDLTENLAYKGIQLPVNQVYEEISNDKTDIPSEKLLTNIKLKDIKPSSPVEVAPEPVDGGVDVASEPVDGGVDVASEPVDGGVDVASEPVDGGVDVASEPVDGGVEVAPEPVDAPDLIPLDEVRIRLGTAKNSNYKLHWEYGNSDLNNKHLLIQGKSGTGKTYLMQCLIQEMSCQKIPTLIIDYSNAFTLNELEEEFKESIGDNLENHFVYTDKFPLNPFRRQQIDLGGIMVDENDIDIAGRFKSVLNEVYNFGDQQLNCINNAILSGLKHYGSKMSLDLFRKELENDDSTHAETALNKLNEFLLHEPFNTKQNFEWTDLDERNGKVIIVQLAALPPSVQRIITELILWDLWFYKKNVTKSKEKPFNVVLDEAQNLNFKDSSPAYKILKEGRKFGWSAWFATQSFTGSMGSKEIDTLNNAEEKIFFKPTGDTSSIAKIISNSNSEQQEWKEKIQLLKKSECIVYGGIKDRNNNLTPSKPIIIKVDPLSSRINEN